jgi:aminopeptidase
MDKNIIKFAKTLVDYSLYIKKGEKVMVDSSFLAKDLLLEVYKRIIQKGAYPLMSIGLPGTAKIYYENASEEQLKKFPDITWYKVLHSQAELGINAPHDTKELKHINPKKIVLRTKATFSISDYIVNEKKKMRRCTTQFPTKALAKDASVSLRRYKKWFYRAVNQDWIKEAKRLKKIHSLFKGANIIQIKAPGTNIQMSVKGRPLIIDDGHENMPGGEMFYAPIRETVNGYIKFTYPAIRAGNEVKGIKLTFKDGKVIKAKARHNEKFLKTMINMDAGSKYVGELGIGCNKLIDKFTKNLLFDEKIGGTIHLALGMAYKECKGKNKSGLHWDIVCDLRKGGQIIKDGKVIQRNGKWIF